MAEVRQARRDSGIAEYQITAEQNCGQEPVLADRMKIMRIIRSSLNLCGTDFCDDTPVPDPIPVFARSGDSFTAPRSNQNRKV